MQKACEWQAQHYPHNRSHTGTCCRCPFLSSGKASDLHVRKPLALECAEGWIPATSAGMTRNFCLMFGEHRNDARLTGYRWGKPAHDNNRISASESDQILFDSLRKFPKLVHHLHIDVALESDDAVDDFVRPGPIPRSENSFLWSSPAGGSMLTSLSSPENRNAYQTCFWPR